MIRVGILFNHDEGWVGGLNYIKNLIHSVHQSSVAAVRITLFVGKGFSPQLRKSLEVYADIIETPLMTRRHPFRILWSLTRRIFKSDMILEWGLSRYKVDVFSHSNVFYLQRIPSVNWIPDFQHIHLPAMFSEKERNQRNHFFLTLLRNSDLVIVSSRDSLKDLTKFSPEYASKARVLNFVPQPKRSLLEYDPERDRQVLEKYSLPAKYFYLPNQFWKHKNHSVAFAALKGLKSRGMNLTLVCSGNMSDYRNRSHTDSLVTYSHTHQLDIRFLGMIDYDDVILLMKNARATLNPSLFEGWSSTVEESKCLGAAMILSDIPVHREQNPSRSYFFNPSSPTELATLLEELSNTASDPTESPVDKTWEERTRRFGEQYVAIIEEAMQNRNRTRP